MSAESDNSEAKATTAAANSAAVLSAPLYPYSVIPGGARNKEELSRAIGNDPVVAAHYADFDEAKTRVMQLDHAELAYVSYRIGAQIFWTRRPVAIPAKELVLTDGTSTARTRCGNRLSMKPAMPVSDREPLDGVMDRAPSLGEYALADQPDFGFAAPSGESPSNAAPANSSAQAFSNSLPSSFLPAPIPLPYFPPFGAGGPGTPGGPPPIVPTPEPDLLALLCGGLSVLTGLAALRAFAKRGLKATRSPRADFERRVQIDMPEWRR